MDKQLKAQLFADKNYNGVRKKCRCGCSQLTTYNARRKDLCDYIRGHQSRVWNPTRDDKEIGKRAIKRAHEERKKQITEGTFTTWNSGLTKDTDERVKTYSEKQIGKVIPQLLKDKQSKRMKDRIKNMKENGTYDDEFNKHVREYWKDPIHRIEQRHRTTERLIKDNYSGKTSKAESKMMKILDSLDINYLHQKNIKGKLFDFVIGKTIIEVDGDFYHARPNLWPNGPIYPIQIKTVENDKIKTKLALQEGYNLIRIWSSEIETKETLKIIKGL